MGVMPLDERRIHRPFDAGDLDLDAADQVDGGSVLLGPMRRLIATRPRGAVQRQQFLTGLGQGSLVVVGHDSEV
jgi:hypothetical protein